MLIVFFAVSPLVALALFAFARRVDPLTGRIRRSPRPFKRRFRRYSVSARAQFQPD